MPSAWLRRFYSQEYQESILSTEEDLSIDHLVGTKDDLAHGVIPLLFGHARIKGKVLLALPKGNEHVVAVGICKGPADLRAIYVNGTVLDINPEEYRFYPGTELQEPDPWIAELVHYLPAFRGLAYVVFNNFSLSRFSGKIPTFRFDVAALGKENRAAKITGVNIIPGSGEFVYDNRPIVKRTRRGDKVVAESAVNSVDKKRANSLVNLELLKRELPGVTWTAPVVCWFATSLDIATCSVVPKVETDLEPGIEYKAFSGGASAYEVDWVVQGKLRSEAELVGRDGSSPRYGGTPSDESVINYLRELRNMGYKVMLYPMLLVDQEGKPWRGQITGNSSHVKSFFQKSDGYNNFILHYAKLAKDYIDAFIIGSEFPALTGVFVEGSHPRVFPAVSEFVSLASKVRSIFQERDIKITYAADWSEYHHSEGGWYNMDPIWMSKDIDVIGIDAYFSLTQSYSSDIARRDIREGYPNLASAAVGISKDWLLGDIEHWWQSKHFNPGGLRTVWQPKAKKVWITEFGFPSVDKSTNEPNKFPDKKSISGGYPVFSSKGIDFAIQEEAILSALAHFESLECIQNSFLWCWDARHPFWPSGAFRCKFRKEMDLCWEDECNWGSGHWVNGKLSNVCLGEILTSLLLEAGFEESEFSIDSSVKCLISGFLVDYRCSIAELLGALSLQYNLFLRRNSQGALEISSASKKTSHLDSCLSLDQLLCDSKLNLFRSRQVSDINALASISLRFIDEEEQRKALVEIHSSLSPRSLILALPLVMSESKASAAAWHIMERIRGSEQTIAIKVHRDCEIRPADMVQIKGHDDFALMRVLSVKETPTEKDLVGLLLAWHGSSSI